METSAPGGGSLTVHQWLCELAPAYLERFGSAMPGRHREVLNKILRCRTAALGGQLFACPDGPGFAYRYHSCNDRHCPQCGQRDTDAWLAQQRARLLLPVPYFLVTFTVPEALRHFIRSHPAIALDLLFAASAQALQDLAQDLRRLGATRPPPAIVAWTSSPTADCAGLIAAHPPMAAHRSGTFRVPPPFPPARPAFRLPSRPPLRLVASGRPTRLQPCPRLAPPTTGPHPGGASHVARPGRPRTSGPSTPRRSTFPPQRRPQMSALSSAHDLGRCLARRPNPAASSGTRASLNLMSTPTSFWSRGRLTLHRRALYGHDSVSPPSPPHPLSVLRPPSSALCPPSPTHPPTRSPLLLRLTLDPHRRSAPRLSP